MWFVYVEMAVADSMRWGGIRGVGGLTWLAGTVEMGGKVKAGMRERSDPPFARNKTANGRQHWKERRQNHLGALRVIHTPERYLLRTVMPTQRWCLSRRQA